MAGEWERVRLGEYILQVRGVSYSPDDVSDTPNGDYIPILRANNIQNEGLNFDDLIYIHNSKISQEQLIREGDIVVCTSSGSKNLVGKSARAQKGLNVSFGAFCKVVRVNKTINSQYIGHYFNSPQYRQIISNLSGGANINNIRNEHIANLTIPLPPLDEQKRIADVLDKASELIKKRKEQIRLMDELAKSLFIEMFGDPVENPMGWDKIPLGKKCNIVTGNTPSRAEPENYGSYIEWIKSDNINTPFSTLTPAKEYLSELGLSKGRFVEGNSVLMTCIAGSISCIGNCSIANRRVAFNQQINAIIPKGENTWYLYYLFTLSKLYIQSTINMSLKGILSKGQLAKLEFMFPPISLQNEFADRIDAIEQQKALLQDGLAKMETAYKALMQEYFG